MKRIKVFIIDDERYSREELRHLLEQFSLIEIIGEAESGDSGIMKILQLQPDVVFLDIEMPKMNGIEVAKSIKELKKVPLLVFATAYPNFAAEAFRCEAIDYLLKPFEEDQLKDTISRIVKQMNPAKENEVASTPSKLAVEENENIVYIDPRDILYLSRDERVTKMVCKDREYETKTSLKELEMRLKDFTFFRIHKSYLVNLEYVTRLIPWFNGAYQLELKHRREQLSVSRNYVKALRHKLEI